MNRTLVAAQTVTATAHQGRSRTGDALTARDREHWRLVRRLSRRRRQLEDALDWLDDVVDLELEAHQRRGHFLGLGVADVAKTDRHRLLELPAAQLEGVLVLEDDVRSRLVGGYRE